MNFIDNFNLFFIYILPIDFWNIIEMTAGIGITFACIIQRAKWDIFSSSESNIIGKWAVKVGQLGLYCQMMLGVVTCVDGYYNYIHNSSHVVLAMWVLSASLVKYSVYLNFINALVQNKVRHMSLQKVHSDQIMD